jgi:hypothetical protein
MTRYADDARHIEQVKRERFSKFNLELHPEKTRIINLDREQRCRTNSKDYQSYTFDFSLFIGVRDVDVLSHGRIL